MRQIGAFESENAENHREKLDDVCCDDQKSVEEDAPVFLVVVAADHAHEGVTRDGFLENDFAALPQAGCFETGIEPHGNIFLCFPVYIFRSDDSSIIQYLGER